MQDKILTDEQVIQLGAAFGMASLAFIRASDAIKGFFQAMESVRLEIQPPDHLWYDPITKSTIYMLLHYNYRHIHFLIRKRKREVFQFHQRERTRTGRGIELHRKEIT